MLQIYAALFLIFVGTTLAQYDLTSGRSAPIGASVSIDNPHAHGGFSPLVPASKTLYFPPPEIPHPDPTYIG